MKRIITSTSVFAFSLIASTSAFAVPGAQLAGPALAQDPGNPNLLNLSVTVNNSGPAMKYDSVISQTMISCGNGYTAKLIPSKTPLPTNFGTNSSTSITFTFQHTPVATDGGSVHCQGVVMPAKDSSAANPNGGVLADLTFTVAKPAGGPVVTKLVAPAFQCGTLKSAFESKANILAQSLTNMSGQLQGIKGFASPAVAANATNLPVAFYKNLIDLGGKNIDDEMAAVVDAAKLYNLHCQNNQAQ